jgi:subtilase family serine protease
MRNVRLHLEELEARNLLSVFTPAQIRHVYGFDQLSFTNGRVQADGSGQTIAIVEAFHDPKIVGDLHYFDWIFGLPDPPKFTQVNQRGGTTFASVNPAWALETALDIEWAHAIAPKANIMLVEADSANFNDLIAAVSFARYQPGVVVVSMSWGSPEFSYEAAYDAYFTTPPGHIGGSGLPGGITFVASSGDNGAGTSYPAVSPNVLAIGGTALTLSAAGGYGSEIAWSDSGGGVSLYESKPSFQMSLVGNMRSTPDVSLNGDPYTGYYIYDTVPYWNNSGWFQDAGTSAGAPQWAALIALADQGRALVGKGSLSNAQSLIYSLPAGDFRDIVSGSNGYAAGLGYDLVTGRGTPRANLIVQHLLGLGRLSVAPVMARGTLSVHSPSAHALIAEATVGADIGGTLVNEGFPEEGIVFGNIEEDPPVAGRHSQSIYLQANETWKSLEPMDYFRGESTGLIAKTSATGVSLDLSNDPALGLLPSNDDSLRLFLPRQMKR